MAQTHGTCADRFSGVRETLEESLEAHDVGASVTVYLDGEPVVDLWGGYADAARTTPWQHDSILNTWSTTKTMTALCALILADRGDLDLTAPVARYWPEFAAAGKQDVEVRHLLSHTAGLPTWDEPMTVADLYDWPKATARLAAQAPRWEPGTQAGYHAVTQGYLVGEVVRRVTGVSLGTFFAREVAGPLGADFHIGLPAEHDGRVIPVIPPPQGEAEAAPRGRGNPPIDPADANTVAWRRAEIPAAGGHGNARSVGAVQSVLACGGTARGVRLLSPEGCERRPGGAVSRAGSHPRRANALRQRLRPAQRLAAQSAVLLLGRLGRLDGRRRPGRQDDRVLRDEPDARPGRQGRRPGIQHRGGRLRRPVRIVRYQEPPASLRARMLTRP